MGMGKEFAHHELAKPARTSCHDNAHRFLGLLFEPAALVQFLEQAVVDEISSLRLARFFARRALENLVDALGAYPWNPIAAVAHTVGLVELAEGLNVSHFGVLR